MSTSVTTIDSLKASLAGQHKKALDNFFNGDEKRTLKFLSAMAYCVQSTPWLLECTQDSIITSFMKCAEYNLFPSSVSGEAYILPYVNKGVKMAQFQLGYQGIITLLYRAGVQSIYTDIVRKNDYFKVFWGLDPRIEHEYALASRWEPIGVYVVCSVNGQKIWKYMAKDEVLAFKEFSKSKNSEFSPWNPKNDPELNMWRKTAIKQISKLLPKNEEIFQAIEQDNSDGDIKEYQERIMLDRAKRESEADVTQLLQSSPTPDTSTSITEEPNE